MTAETVKNIMAARDRLESALKAIKEKNPEHLLKMLEQARKCIKSAEEREWAHHKVKTMRDLANR